MDPAAGRGGPDDGRALLLPAAGRGRILGSLGHPAQCPHPRPPALLLDRVAQATTRDSAWILVQALHAVPGCALRASAAGPRESRDDRSLVLSARDPPVARDHAGARPALASAGERGVQRRRPG